MSAVAPAPVRRVVVVPVVILLTALLLASTPLIVLGLAFAVRFTKRRWRPLRLYWFLLVYLVRESVGIFALIALWVMSGFGWKLRSDRIVRAHVKLEGWYLGGLVKSAQRVLGLRVIPEDVPAELQVPDPFRAGSGEGARPVLVFSRHAGAGDSFILTQLLVDRYGRRPRIVLKDLLQYDPCIDIVLNRLPNRFISPNPPPGSGVIDSISALASGLEPDGALLLFPEGGNFTEHRHARAIEKLEAAGHHEDAEVARGLQHLLPPRPGGTFAAIDAAPDADILFVAHTGLEQLSSLRDLWAGLPMDRDVHVSWWPVDRADVPVDPEERVHWLFHWWVVLEAWIDEHHDPERPGRAHVAPGGGPDDAQPPGVASPA
jgi:1-acyl-sn-glycerol-3-phosphate acyltransferase